MSWKQRAQRSYDAAQFLSAAAPAAGFVTTVLFVARATKPAVVGVIVTAILLYAAHVAKSRTKKYQQLSQLSNIARSSMAHPKYKQRDYDQIASWMSEGPP